MMDAEIKATMINLYEKFADAGRSREFLTSKLASVEMLNIEKALRAGKSVPLGKCPCEHIAEPNISKVNAVESNPGNCYLCLKKCLSREKLHQNEKVDYLGWGLAGLFEQQSSEESSESTSTDDDHRLERRLSAHRHKILRKLRRRKPEVFEPNYVEVKSDDILKIDDPEVRKMIKKSKSADTKEEKKKVQNQKPTASFKRFRKNASLKEFTVYGGCKFDFSNEFLLKDKYSSMKFDFLTGIIHYYQKYLKQHPEEHYPSVSELMTKSGQVVCKDEEDIVARYYDVLRKKGGQKKIQSVVGKASTGDSNELSERSSSEQPKPRNYVSILTREELCQVRKGGILDLSGRSIVDIPGEVWTTDKNIVERPSSPNRRNFSNSSPIRSKVCKPLSYLNLSHNKITRFYPKGSALESLAHLSLSNNKIDYLPNEFGNFKCLEVLDLENNLLTLLPNSFCSLTSLKELNLRRNCLLDLPVTFGTLKKLKSIDLRWNKLIQLPDTFEDLESLGNLNVAFNKLKFLPIDISNLYNLIVLDVSYNKLSRLPMLSYMPKLLLVNAMGNLIKEFPKFSLSKSLCEIRLDGNRIKDIITDNLTDCPVVQLTLSHNKIHSIPDDFYKVETLVLLDCTNNRLSSLPWSIARLKYLTCLRVEENHISDIDKSVIESGSKAILDVLLKNLLQYEGEDDVIMNAKKDVEVLYIRGNTPTSPIKNRKLDPKEVAKTRSLIKKRLELTELPNDWVKVAQQCNVSIVDISKNKFRFIPAGLKALSASLKELIIKENTIKTVPDFVGRMPQLILLDLTFNHLENLPLTMTTCRLTKLICRRNLFSAIPKVVYMILTLEHLDFSENTLKEIDVDGLRNLRKLNHLNLSKNEIKKLPSSLGYLVNLRQLDVTDNPFKRPGQYIIRGGTQVIMDYLKRHPDP